MKIAVGVTFDEPERAMHFLEPCWAADATALGECYPTCTTAADCVTPNASPILDLDDYDCVDGRLAPSPVGSWLPTPTIPANSRFHFEHIEMHSCGPPWIFH